MNANRQFIIEQYMITYERYVEFYNAFVEMLDLNPAECYVLKGLLEQVEAKVKAEMALDENGITSAEAIRVYNVHSIGA